MATTGEESRSFEYTSTWIVAVVCFIIVLISLIAERGLNKLGKFFHHKNQYSLYEALQKLKDELMLLGFISLLLTVFQGAISRICVSPDIASIMLPCKMPTTSAAASHYTVNNARRLLQDTVTSLEHCARKGKVPFLSVEAVHQLHIFIFVLAVTHVVFCAITMVLGLAKIREWGLWERSIGYDHRSRPHRADATNSLHLEQFKERAGNYWRKKTIVSWIVAFFKQFYGSVTKSDYITLRSGFIRAHIPGQPGYDFHNYMLRTLENDFKKVVGISWYLWLFVVIFLLMNIQGWHTYFWLSFLPLFLLLLGGAKLEHIISELAQEVAERETLEDPDAAAPVRPSDELFWFHRPAIVLYLLHFILFQNSFEIAFFFWVWVTYGFRSCMMGELAFIIPRLVIGVIVEVLCAYSTLPLYALVTQMGTMFKPAMLSDDVRGVLEDWAKQKRSGTLDKNAARSIESVTVFDTPTTADEEITVSMVELSSSDSGGSGF